MILGRLAHSVLTRVILQTCESMKKSKKYVAIVLDERSDRFLVESTFNFVINNHCVLLTNTMKKLGLNFDHSLRVREYVFPCTQKDNMTLL